MAIHKPHLQLYWPLTRLQIAPGQTSPEASGRYLSAAPRFILHLDVDHPQHLLSGFFWQTQPTKEETVQEDLCKFAVTITRHKQLIASHHGVAFDDGDPLLHFVSVTHGAAPIAGRILLLEELNKQQMLSFAHWEGVWCAIIADVRSLYQETLEAPGGKILHNHGSSSIESDAPFTVAAMQAQLEEIWTRITDAQFVGPLEVAVRINEHAQIFRKADLDYAFRQTFAEVWEKYSPAEKTDILNSTLGMLDAANMSAEKIHEDLRAHCFPKLIQAGHEELGIPYTGPHQDQQYGQQQPREPPHPLSEDNTCCCPPECACHIVCQYGIHQCECKTRAQRTRSAPTPAPSSSPAPPLPPLPSGPPRPRGNTTGSYRYHHAHGAHHPPRRQPLKDVYPTDFYLSRGSGRYPAFSSSPPEPREAPIATSSSPFHPPAARITPAPLAQPSPFHSRAARTPPLPPTQSLPFHPSSAGITPALPTHSSPFAQLPVRTTPAPPANSSPFSQVPARTAPEFPAYSSPFSEVPARTNTAYPVNSSPFSQLPMRTAPEFSAHSSPFSQGAASAAPAPPVHPSPFSQVPMRTAPAPSTHSSPFSPPPARITPAPPAHSPPRSPEPGSEPLRSSLTNRRLVPAGGNLPLAQRPSIPQTYLPTAPEERGFSISREEYAALPAPRPAAAYTTGGRNEGAPSRSRRPSWIKRVFGGKKGSRD
ncbi:hypothetical protein BST61_g4286 [Cercospora zeina]